MMKKRMEMGATTYANLDPAESRVVLAENAKPFRKPPERVGRVRDQKIPGPGGDIGVRIRWPKDDGTFPALLFFHGGGWFAGTLDDTDEVCARLTNHAKVVVISVDYRLAPENRFPAALEDCYTAAVWTMQNARPLGIDPTRLAVGGSSAGANLAATLCLKVRDQGGPSIARQVLVCPVTDMTRDLSKYDGKEFGPTNLEMQWSYQNYLNRREDASNPFASPLLADLRRLPPATMITAQYDTLAEQASDYARKLRKAGVRVKKREYRGMVHGFFNMPGYFDSSREALDWVAIELGRTRPSPSKERK